MEAILEKERKEAEANASEAELVELIAKQKADAEAMRLKI